MLKSSQRRALQLRLPFNSAEHQLQAISRGVEGPCVFEGEELPPSSSPPFPTFCSNSTIPVELCIKGETTFSEFSPQMTVLNSQFEELT